MKNHFNAIQGRATTQVESHHEARFADSLGKVRRSRGEGGKTRGSGGQGSAGRERE